MAEKLFNVGVKGIIFQKGRVLLLESASGYWEFPGGRMDANETIEETLHRELREELPNIHSIVLNEVLEALRIHKDIKENVSLVLIFYTLDADFSGEPKLSHEHTAYRWTTEKEAIQLVPEDNRSVVHQAFAEHAQRNR